MFTVEIVIRFVKVKPSFLSVHEAYARSTWQFELNTIKQMTEYYGT